MPEIREQLYKILRFDAPSGHSYKLKLSLDHFGIEVTCWTHQSNPIRIPCEDIQALAEALFHGQAWLKEQHGA